MKAVFLDYASLAPADLDKSGLTDILPELVLRDNTDPEDVEHNIEHAEVVFTNKVILGSETITKAGNAANSLKIICSAATGFNHIDVQAANAVNIPVCNVRDYANDSVAEHVFALLLNLQRNISAYRDYVDHGDWSKSESFCGLSFPIRELKGLTMGIIGYGSLGKSTARLARCLGMQIQIAQRPGSKKQKSDRVSLEELYRISDVISLHCPLNDQTRDLIGTDEFKQMKSTAVIINTARGGIINETALVEALNSGKISAAGIDVLAEEPPASASILPAQKLSNLIVTPHIAWASQRARQNVLDQLVLMVQQWQEGKLYNQVIQ